MSRIAEENEKLVSIVIPVFNEESTIRRVVQRVIEQVPHPIEIIIVDDGSTDGTSDAVLELATQDSRILSARQTNA